jgi:hypothetical protein
MKLNRREIVHLLNALMIQQDYYNKQNENAPKGKDFVAFEDACQLVMEEQAENPMVMVKEFDDLFSKLVYHGFNDLSPEEEELFSLPPTDIQ